MKRAWVVLIALATSAAADQMASGTPSTSFVISDYVTGLGEVTDFRWLPDGRMVIIQKTGEVRIRHTDGNLFSAGTFTVESSSELGLLGVAVDPAFATSSLLYFYYSVADANGGSDTDRGRVVSVQLTGDTLNMSSQTILLRGIQSSLHNGGGNHNGGELEVGPDGRLYVGVGDTGHNSGLSPYPTPYTPTNYWGTCLTNPNGKILRIERDGGIPSDNPLASLSAVTACGSSAGTAISSTTGAPRRDIYAWGFRNPFRFSFDPVTGNLWAGDVGEVAFEEVDVVARGTHSGWPWREGEFGFDAGICTRVVPDAGPCVDPTYFYQHDGIGAPNVDNAGSSSAAITGGVFVDNGCWPAGFSGLYYFGDNVVGTVWSLRPNGARTGAAPYPDGGSPRQDFAFIQNGNAPVAFHVGPDGNLYLAAYPISGGTGRIVQIRPASIASGCDAGLPSFDAGMDGGAGSDGGGGGPGGGGGGGGPGPGSGVANGCSCGEGIGAPLLIVAALALLSAAARRRRA